MAQPHIPMPKPTLPKKPLNQYKLLTFDIYGTLIEYKRHILTSFEPLLARLPASSTYLSREPLPNTSHIAGAATQGQVTFLKLFQAQEDRIKLEKPVRRFDEILREIWRRVAAEIGVQTDENEVQRFGSEGNIASWEVFKGTLEALKRLERRYKLVGLSNIDEYAWGITRTSSGLGEVGWSRVFTAEEFGEDLRKADDAKLERVVEWIGEEGIAKEQWLHVAQSLGHDHAPAKRLGLGSVFLVGDGEVWGKEDESKMAVEKGLVGYGWRCRDLVEFSEMVEQEFESSG